MTEENGLEIMIRSFTIPPLLLAYYLLIGNRDGNDNEADRVEC
jgi:hypothetical protein